MTRTHSAYYPRPKTNKQTTETGIDSSANDSVQKSRNNQTKNREEMFCSTQKYKVPIARFFLFAIESSYPTARKSLSSNRSYLPPFACRRAFCGSSI
jgi:hypothetical protein